MRDGGSYPWIRVTGCPFASESVAGDPGSRALERVLLPVHDVPRRLPAEEPGDVLEGRLEGPGGLLRQRPRDVRGHHDIRQLVERLRERAALPPRVLPPDVERRDERRLRLERPAHVPLTHQ